MAKHRTTAPKDNVTTKKVKFVCKKEKEIDPFKVNAVQVLQRIAFTKVEDRLLMNDAEIVKNDTSKLFLGYDNPTTCQINLNFLYCKAIASMEKRLAVLERICKEINSEGNGAASTKCKKRKRAAEDTVSGSKDVSVSCETINLDSDVTKDGFQKEEAGVEQIVKDVGMQTEEGEIVDDGKQ